MLKEIIILHDYGVRDHYIALNSVGSASTIKEVEFTVVPTFFRGLIKFDLNKLRKSIFNLMWIVRSIINPKVNSDKNIILGMAPFDWRVIYIKRVVKCSNVILHTSWTSWNDDFHPRRNYFFSVYYKNIWRDFLRFNVNSIAAVTTTVKKEISLFCKDATIESKTYCVYHSIHDLPVKKNDDSRTGTLKVIYAGNIIEQKGIFKILELCKINPDVEFTFIGKGPLLGEIENSNLTNVKCLGYISDKRKLYSEFSDNDLYLLPSLRKGKWEELFGIALVEAMYNGCIPLTTDHTGPSEILHESFLKENIFSEDLYVSGVNEFIGKLKSNPELIGVYKQEAFKVSQKFTASNLAKVWETMLI